MRDDLQTWLRVRQTVCWATAGPAIAGPVAGSRDGIAHFVDTVERGRDPARADRLLAALELARADASPNVQLTLSLAASWQRVVLGVPAVAFRTRPAYAKGGRERYGWTQRHPGSSSAACARAQMSPYRGLLVRRGSISTWRSSIRLSTATPVRRWSRCTSYWPESTSYSIEPAHCPSPSGEPTTRRARLPWPIS